MKESTFEKYKSVIDEYLVNGMNGTKAYQKLYPSSSDDTGATEFLRILRIPKIDAYVKERQFETRKQLKITHQDILNQLHIWANSDITETIMLTPNEVKELPIDIRRLITKYKHTKRQFEGGYEEYIELSFVSKERALDMISKHTGFYAEHNFQKNNGLTKEERAKRIAELKEKLHK